MDRLTDLPLNPNSQKTPEESQILNQFFPGKPQENQEVPSNPNPSPQNQKKMNWKVIGITTLLFVLLANPWMDGLFCKIPYCGENSTVIFGVKTILFMLLIIVLTFFF